MLLQQLQMGHIFYWAQWLYRRMLCKLTYVQHGTLRSFYYASVLCTIMYERVVMLCLILELLTGPATDPRIRCWAPVMSRARDGVARRYLNATIEYWLKSNPQLILEYTYHGMDFWGDPDMELPPGDA